MKANTKHKMILRKPFRKSRITQSFKNRMLFVVMLSALESCSIMYDNDLHNVFERLQMGCY